MKALYKVKSQTKGHTLLHKMSRIGKSIETENKLVVTRGWERGKRVGEISV